MYFYDDNELDNKKSLFENKYGKLSSSVDIVKDITKKDSINKSENQNNNQNKTLLKKRKRKRHDSSDEEEKKLETEKKKEEEKEKNKEKEEFIEKINNVENLDLDDKKNTKNENKEIEGKDSWKKSFVTIEELNNKKIEVKEVSKLLDDPMKNLLSKNKIIEETDELIKKRGFYLPKCKFAPLNNRFDIKPGYRWDGVNRSNGFENKIMNLNFNINNE